jgi:hypothetical protein
MKNLVVNGCSYMEGYARGNGHSDLAKQLGIASAESLAIGGSANSRIIRTTVKHSYQAAEPTFYIMGLTFVSRSELPILRVKDEVADFEGRWINPQNQEFADRYDHFWNRDWSEQFVKFKLMTEVYSLIDRTEDLMYNTLSAIHSLQSRGHRVLVYQQADTDYHGFLNTPKLQPYQSTKNIIDGFKFAAVIYQHEQGVAKEPDVGAGNFIGPKAVPEHIRHPKPGQHQVLNDFLVDYIRTHNLLND